MNSLSDFTINFDIIDDWVKLDTDYKIYGNGYNADGTPVPFTHTLKYTSEYNNCEKSRILLDLIPCFLSKEQFNISFDVSATSLITKLFDRYCGEDTVVITSTWEHENVVKILEKTPNVHTINIYEDNICDQIHQIDVEDKNVFVYIIGTQISTGVITKTSVFEQIKETLKSYQCKDITIVIDDVQGMFIVPRDYEFADYVIGTAHSLIIQYDLGFILYKKNKYNVGFN